MNKQLFIGFTLGIVISFSLVYFRDVYKDHPYYGNVASTPTLFVFTKDGRSVDIKPIMFAALNSRDLDPDLFNYYKNIIIIEQEETWIVSFHILGNGNLERKYFYSNYIDVFDGSFQVELSKEELSIMKPHTSSLKSVLPDFEKIQVIIEGTAEGVGP